MKIIFVCTGNTCRSPMAQALAKKVFGEEGLENFEVLSRGLTVFISTGASENAKRAIAEYDLKMDKHTAKQISKADIESADLILTMTKRHKFAILNDYPEKKVFTLKGLAYGREGDITDPFGGDLDKYKSCAAEINDALKNVAKILIYGGRKEDRKEKIAIGCDHSALDMKKELIHYLEEMGYHYKDFGTHTTDSCDYPLYGKKVAEAVAEGRYDKGILICGTGIGISITANKVKGIRAALCHDTFSAKATREHNDANIIAMGARVIGPGLAVEILKAFLETPFSEDERHIRRISMIED